MLSNEENELVTRVSAGTPMGRVMRRYWVPALLTSELPHADCAPVRVRLLGERLVAFRDSQGRVGLLEEFCAHRRVSLFLGRNEENGLRCVYHGWKYDVEGKCLDMPNEPPEYDFKEKIRLTAYPTVELGGVIWAYLGPREIKPVFPKFEWTQVPESHRVVSKSWQECNWLQALEGGIDSSHSSFLHRALRDDAENYGVRGVRVTSTAPKNEVEVTDYGLVYVSSRSIDERQQYVRVYHYVMPFHTFFARQVGQGDKRKPQISGHIFVPMDDENCMVYNLSYSFGEEPLFEKESIEIFRGRGPGEVLPDFRKRRNKDNDWLIDRRVQKSETFSGIHGINTQDHAVQESMGAIVDRTQEHLGSSDKAVIAARRLLIQVAKTIKDNDRVPGIGPSYYNVRAIDQIIDEGVHWQKALEAEVYPANSKERAAEDLTRRERLAH
jgi:phenylpropionate dioxygenase-like ring-hydroxylating dioxygenase large terminal subunit